MAKATKTARTAGKTPKKLAKKYDEKLNSKGAFEDLVNELVTPLAPIKKLK